MPIRPHYLAAMAATIARASDIAARRSGAPVTVHYESGHRQVIEAATPHRLVRDQGGIVAVEADADTGYSLYAGAACHPILILRSDRGGVEFDIPVRAGSIRVEDALEHSPERAIRHGRG
ncbi:hypothetical protein NI17_021330 [Thermobifida halotolerans]|uniref:Uncharacterized protein n=1 Tax=Thermobifida halotolerans TaxID=483545 RepID=A0AA97M3R8_9ACTN|nr:hypothetical protein [Thermobifida halotolerans]UOE19255.1 hypothetical protein NI17_021330 [Thermobifida halotolerans]